MAQKPVSRTRVAVLILSCVGLALAATSMSAVAQTGAPAVAAAETPSSALSRHLRELARSPRSFQALIGAGRAALELGDTQSAAGFFGRADEVWPTSPLPHIGIGAASAQEGDANGALAHFERARALGASAVTMGADRGLAYDLLGRHREAQADYRAALGGSEKDEARRRLALSLAISGDSAAALETLAPLLSRRDMAATRTRALVLALQGDQNGARQAIDWSMPGGWAKMGPFLGRLSALNSAQKASAVHLGIFPDAGQSGTAMSAAERDRLAEVEALLRGPQAQPQAVPPATAIASVVQAPPLPAPQPQVMGPPAPARAAAASTSVTAVQKRRHWLQLASGPSAEPFPEQFRRTKARSGELLNGIDGYVAEEQGRARLLVGPFRNVEDAKIFAEELASEGVRAFSWTSADGQPIRKIANE
jgi:Flp pilus assembly protein TadD